MLADWRIVRDDLTHPQVVALLELHLRAAYEHYRAFSRYYTLALA